MTKLELKLIGVIIFLIALFGAYVKYMRPDPVIMINETGFNFSGKAEGITEELTEELRVEGIATPIIHGNDNMTNPEAEIAEKPQEIHSDEKVELKSFPAYLYIGKRRVYQEYKITPQVKTDGNATARLTGTFTAFGEYDFDLNLKTIEEKSQKPNWLRPKIGAGWYGSKTEGIGMASVGVILFDTISINASGLSSGQLGVFAEYIF